jgi:DNA-binding transcriptional MocR family regulator
MKKLDKCYSAVLQSSAKGISADDIAMKLGIHRTTVYSYLDSLDAMGKVESNHGLWFAKTGEQTAKPLEREIVIELPIPKNQWQQVALLEAFAKIFEGEGSPKTPSTYRIALDALRETRTIRIKGKNVDDLDLEKLGNLIQQANEKSSKVNLRGLFKSLKRSQPDSKKPSF